MEKLIYVADDEKNIRSMVKMFLENEGYQVETFSDGYSAGIAVKEKAPDLLILDIMMPGEDGLSICTRLRKESALPIIIISAKDSPLDRVTGLMLGSDDYITKPFLPMELVARVKALFRRLELSQKNQTAEIISCGNLEMNPSSRIAKAGEEILSITPLEFDFFLYLCRRRETAVERSELLRKIWKYPGSQEDARVSDDLVKRLRKKMRDKHSTARIETVWGYGYRLTERSHSL